MADVTYKQKRAIWAAECARTRPEALRAMEAYVSHAEAHELLDLAVAPLELIEYAAGRRPTELLMKRVKASIGAREAES
jgi:hypothetical protein